jgi:acyl carrier protein
MTNPSASQTGTSQTGTLTAQAVQQWLTEKIAQRLGVQPGQVDPEKYFDEFGLDSTEALVLAGELEAWLGLELEPTALWYHPTIAQLAPYIVTTKQANDDGAS